MKFTGKISGVMVTEFQINNMLFHKQLITLDECIEKVNRQETMNWILDKLRFTKGEGGKWYAIVDWDTIMKLSILEYYPDYEKEMINYFGNDWMNHYIRFNH